MVILNQLEYLLSILIAKQGKYGKPISNHRNIMAIENEHTKLHPELSKTSLIL